MRRTQLVFAISLLAMALFPPASHAQATKVCETDLPCIPGYAGYAIHDMGHSFTAIAAAEGVRLIAPDMEQTDRYLIGTVALPLLQELFDYTVFHVLAGDGFSSLPSDGMGDFMTYQGAWIVPLVRERKYWQAALVGVVWGGYIAMRAHQKEANE